MSKYQQRGPYHFVEYADKDSTYAKHVDDLLMQLQLSIGIGDSMLAIEIGCGEGLILNQIMLRLGWQCEGNDIDPFAAEMARRMCPGAIIHQSGEVDGYEPGCDVILFCDSLEHIKDWRGHLEWAKRLSEWIVVAVPDRHDPNGVRDFATNSFDSILSDWGTCVHRATRHARHLTIWKRNA